MSVHFAGAVSVELRLVDRVRKLVCQFQIWVLTDEVNAGQVIGVTMFDKVHIVFMESAAEERDSLKKSS